MSLITHAMILLQNSHCSEADKKRIVGELVTAATVTAVAPGRLLATPAQLLEGVKQEIARAESMRADLRADLRPRPPTFRPGMPSSADQKRMPFVVAEPRTQALRPVPQLPAGASVEPLRTRPEIPSVEASAPSPVVPEYVSDEPLDYDEEDAP